MPTADRAECWVFLSQEIPMPLKGRHRCVGSPVKVANHIGVAGANDRLVDLTLIVGTDDFVVHVNPAHIIAVMPTRVA